MGPLRATVRNGRLQLDEPTTLPDGTVLDLVVDDEGDDLDEAERAVLHEAIARGWSSIEAGQGVSAEDAIERLRRRQ